MAESQYRLPERDSQNLSLRLIGRKGREMDTPVTKKNIVRRQSTFITWFFSILMIILALLWATDIVDIHHIQRLDVIVAAAVVTFSFISVGVFIYKNKEDDRRLMRSIEKQENYLHTDFDRDMQDTCINGMLSDGLEIVAYGDWFVAMYLGCAFVANRKYIASIRGVRKETHKDRTKNGIRVYTMLVVEILTVEQTVMTWTVGGMYRMPIHFFSKWLEDTNSDTAHAEIHKFYNYD